MSEPIQQIAHETTKILVTGVSGTGKTHFFNRYLLNAPQAQRFVFDHQGEIAQRLQIPACYSLEELTENTAKESLVIFDPSELFPGDAEAGFAMFCDYVFEYSRGTSHTKLLACDELQLLTGTNMIVPELQAVLQTGRRAALDFLACSQQPNELHNKIRNQLTDVISFRQVDPLVLDVMALWGFDLDLVQSLNPGEYISKDRRKGRPDFLGKIILDGKV